MNEPATDKQKDIIVELAAKAGTPVHRNGTWPNPFTKWDAKNMIDVLRDKIEEQQQQGVKKKLVQDLLDIFT